MGCRPPFAYQDFLYKTINAKYAIFHTHLYLGQISNVQYTLKHAEPFVVSILNETIHSKKIDREWEAKYKFSHLKPTSGYKIDPKLFMIISSQTNVSGCHVEIEWEDYYELNETIKIVQNDKTPEFDKIIKKATNIECIHKENFEYVKKILIGA